MSCPENENVCSVKKENNLGYYRLHTIWRDDGFILNIASNNGAWRGEMTSRDIKNMSSQLEMEPKDYLQQCKTALTTHDGQHNMTYAVDNGTFTWKKILDEDSGIKLKLGSIMLKSTSFVETIQNLVTVALECNKKLEKELKEVTKDKQTIEISNSELTKKLEKLIKSKNLMENDLYSKFVLLLNSKKEKIAELSSQLNKSQIGSERQDNPYEMDTDDDDDDDDDDEEEGSEDDTKKSERLRRMNKSRRSPMLGESSKEKREEKDFEEETSSDDMSGSSCVKSTKSEESMASEHKKSEMPSTKDELLNFFFDS